jgi:hypothetical protein
VIELVGAEEEDTSDGQHGTALVARHDFQGLWIRPRQLANGFEEFGISSEVDGFRVQLRLGLFVERRNLVIAPHLFDRLLYFHLVLKEAPS